MNSKHRNSFFEKKLWYDRQLLKAANEQIPNQRKYILEHPVEIAKILGLSKDEKIRSYIVSNTMDFDGAFIKAHHEMLWNDEQERAPYLLAKYLDSNVLFDYLDDEVKNIDSEVSLGGIKIKAPSSTYRIR